MKFIFFLVMSILATCAFGSTEIYSGQGGHYSEIRITELKPQKYYIETCAGFGNLCLPISGTAYQQGNMLYANQDFYIVGQYGNYRCPYRINFDFTLSVDRSTLSILEYGPRVFPIQSTGCPQANFLQYGLRDEPVVYQKKNSSPSVLPVKTNSPQNNGTNECTASNVGAVCGEVVSNQFYGPTRGICSPDPSGSTQEKKFSCVYGL